MKAIVQEKYGSPDVLQVADVLKPKLEEGEVLIHIKATALNAPDWRLLRGKPFLMRLMTGISRPKNKIKGSEFSGTVVAIGNNVNNYKKGDHVIGDVADAGFGAFADYICVKSSLLAHKPNNLSHIEAAALPLTAVTALQGLRDLGQVKKGEKVLIIGASGGVGSYALQLAKYYEAIVTAVTSEKSADQVKGLGADHIIFYTTTSLETVDDSYDLIVAVNGYNPLKTYKKLLKPKGRLVMIGGKSMKQIIFISSFGSLISKKNGQSFKGLLAKANGKDLSFISQLAHEKAIKPVIYKEIDFEEIPEGIAELEHGHVSGKIVTWVNKD
jgi:NADPH:quinone reductase-like Zn-dependent oxidoreductase